MPDGNGEFTEAMGMLVDKDDLGFGKRSWRYSMLEYLAPGARKPIDVAVLSRPGCPFCAKAKTLLDDATLEYDELMLNRDYSDRGLRALTAAATFPPVLYGTARLLFLDVCQGLAFRGLSAGIRCYRQFESGRCP